MNVKINAIFCPAGTGLISMRGREGDGVVQLETNSKPGVYVGKPIPTNQGRGGRTKETKD